MFNVILILTLLNIKGIGRKTANNLIKSNLPQDLDCSSIRNFLIENKYKIKRTSVVEMKEIIDAKRKCEKIIKICKEEHINIISILDEEFPRKLKIIDDNPILFYYKGDFQCIKNNKSIALIGSRKPTQESQLVAYNIGEFLVKNNFIIIGGLALGCDTYGHQSAVNHNEKTVAVMPCGLNEIYPKENLKLAEDILHNGGCIISEYPPNSTVYKNQFIERDRLQSALSSGLIVVETTSKGGTMHTVNFALKQNKLIGCCKCETNNHLLKNNKIHSICDEKSLEEFLNLVNKKRKEIYIQIPLNM